MGIVELNKRRRRIDSKSEKTGNPMSSIGSMDIAYPYT